MESNSLLFSLATMEEIALWQREGVSSGNGGMSSRSTSVAMSGSGLMSVEGVAWAVGLVRC